MNFSADKYTTFLFSDGELTMCQAIACIRCVLPSPTPPYRNKGLLPNIGSIDSATRFAAVNANSFGFPTTKLSKVNLGSSGEPRL